MIRLFVVPLLAVLAACVPDAPADDPYQPPQMSRAETAACAADGGHIGIAGLLGGEICVRPTADAGQACTRSSQCTAYCDAVTRTCAANDYPFGCRSYLDEDGTTIDICID